ncbi:MAG: carboxyl transferase domain-containing protein, partial [Capnocytophaga gingivalis]|uniref:carboxyl transferase domain-containing protein n=1 Tax=Capnocytophaga gingivalis TaxID=1017 RepID=UPI00362201A4
TAAKESLEKDGKSDSVVTERIVEKGEERHVIKAIIGAEDGLGVECLKGSGLIAGATSRAYKDIFTITLVTCRSVGIGAYLVRLGQRAIQIDGQPIILTGAPAINKLLGKVFDNRFFAGEEFVFLQAHKGSAFFQSYVLSETCGSRVGNLFLYRRKFWMPS